MGHREALLEGALTCLQEKGYARTTARDVVEVSGANLGSIVYHFGTMENLLTEALLEAFRRLRTEIGTAVAVDNEAEPWELLRRGLTVALDSFEENGPLWIAFTEAAAQARRSQKLREEMGRGFEEGRTAISALIEQALPAGHDLDPRMTASVLIAIIDGLMLQWLADPSRVPDADGVVKSLQDGAGLRGPPVKASG
jgi:AcrR family transcriptional regulator